MLLGNLGWPRLRWNQNETAKMMMSGVTRGRAQYLLCTNEKLQVVSLKVIFENSLSERPRHYF